MAVIPVSVWSVPWIYLAARHEDVVGFYHVETAAQTTADGVRRFDLTAYCLPTVHQSAKNIAHKI